MVLMKAGSCSVGACGVRGSVELEVLFPATTIKSCISGRPRLFTGLIQLCHTSHLRVSSWQSTSVLSLGSDPWTSAPSPQLLQWACKQLLGWEVLVGTDLWVKFSVLSSTNLFLCSPLRFWSSPWPCPWRGFWVYKILLLHSSLAEVQDPSNFLCLFIFLLPFSCYFMWNLACLLGSLRSSTRLHQVFYRWSRCRYTVGVFVGRKMTSMSYSSDIFTLSSWKHYLTING